MLPALPLDGNDRTLGREGAWLSVLPLPGMSAPVHRAHGLGAEPAAGAHLIVHWRLRLKLSLRDLAEILLLRGLAFSHEAVRELNRTGFPGGHLA